MTRRQQLMGLGGSALHQRLPATRPSPQSRSESEEGAQRLRALAERSAPSKIVGEAASFEDCLRPLVGPEIAAVRGACAKRQKEFQAGRHCAHSALQRLGQPPGAVRQRRDRQPEWPEGVVGSISHAGNLELGCAIAVVARNDRFRGIGVDVELDRALSEDLWATILTEDELRELAPLSQEARGRAALQHFSAKEAVFKAQYPVFECFLGFQDVQLNWLTDSRFTAEVSVPKVHLWLRRHRSEGCFQPCKPWVLSLFSVLAH